MISLNSSSNVTIHQSSSNFTALSALQHIIHQSSSNVTALSA